MLYLTLNIIPPENVIEHNVFIKDPDAKRPMLAAHRGGSLNNPENTLKAFKAAVSEYGNDIIESDIWLTKDGKIVFSHDKSIDRMSDVKLFDDTKDEHLIAEIITSGINSLMRLILEMNCSLVYFLFMSLST